MTAQEFINAIKQAKDIDIAPITFWVGDQCYELDRIGQFGISAEITFTLVPTTLPILEKVVIRRDKKKMVNKKMKEIKKKR